MQFSSGKYRDLPEFPVYLLNKPMKFVDQFKYLGHIISSDLSDRHDMEKAKRAIYARGNILVRKFGRCTDEVKLNLFRSYITPIYGCHLWANYTVRQFNTVKVAYNCVFRKLFGISRFMSVSMNMVSRRVPTLIEIIRKGTLGVMTRLRSSKNHVAADLNHAVTMTTFIGRTYMSRYMSLKRN